MKNFLLCCVIVVAGSFAIQNFTVANSDPVVKKDQQIELEFGLSESDLNKINGIVDEKLDPIRDDLRTVERSLSDRIDDLQNKLSDCNTRYETLSKLKSGGGSTGNVVANKYEPKPSVVKSYGGGSTGNVTQSYYAQPVVAPVVVQSVPYQSPSVSRTVTRSNVQASNCPGGVCPTNTNAVTRSYSRPRMFSR